MKLSIKFLAIIALLFTFTSPAHAQRGGGTPPSPEKMAEKQTAQMAKKLGLNDSQVTTISDINLVYAKKMHESHEANKGNRDAMKEMGAAIQSDKNAEMKLVLTEAQFKSYEELQLNEERGKGGKGGKGGPRHN